MLLAVVNPRARSDNYKELSLRYAKITRNSNDVVAIAHIRAVFIYY